MDWQVFLFGLTLVALFVIASFIVVYGGFYIGIIVIPALLAWGRIL